MRLLSILCSVALAFTLLISASKQAFAAPADLHTWCVNHPNDDSFSQQQVRNLGVTGYYYPAFRCMDGKVLICELGATGEGCLKSHRIDDAFKASVSQFCNQKPNTDFIPESIVSGYASNWRCSGRTPVETRILPVDKNGFYIGSWKPLHVKETPGLERMRQDLLSQYYGDLWAIDQVADNADYAALAAHLYGGTKEHPAYPLPDGWTAVDKAPQKISNFPTGDLIYETFVNKDWQYALVFQGTHEWRQWFDDTVGEKLPLPLSKEIGQVARAAVALHPNIIFVGHSLGGRAADVARLLTGHDAVIFNASIPSDKEKQLIKESGSPPGHLISFRSPQDPVSATLAPVRGDISVENMARIASNAPQQSLFLGMQGPVHQSLAYVTTILVNAKSYAHKMSVLAAAMRYVQITVELTDMTKTSIQRPINGN